MHFDLIRLTILSIIRLNSISPAHIKQQLSTMNPETRVIIVHTTSYVKNFILSDFSKYFSVFY